MLSHQLQSKTGTYVIWLQLGSERQIQVGRLGKVILKPGYYAYVGSAFGPGGVHARLGRHFKTHKKKRWHIDYLRAVCSVREAWVSYDKQRLEHRWADRLMGLKGAWLPAARFGASDCSCAAHLIGFARLPSLQRFLEGMEHTDLAVERIKPEL